MILEEFTIYEGTPLHAGFPDVNIAPNGDILVVFRVGKAHVWGRDGRIFLSRSRDRGKSWETKEIIHIPERFVRYEGEYSLVSDDRDPSIATLSNGQIILNWFHWGDGDRDNPTSSIYVSFSSDNGETWEEPKMIFPNSATSDSVLELRKGVLLLPAYGPLEGKGSSAFLLISEDYGKSWEKKPIIIAEGGKEGIEFYEPAIAKLDDEGKRLISVLRTNLGPLYISQSKDGGASWDEPRPLPFYGHSPHLLRLRDGRIILSFRDTELYFKESWFLEKLLYNLGLRDIRPTAPIPKGKDLPEATAMVEALPPEYSFEKERKRIIYKPRGHVTSSGDLLLGDSGYPSAVQLDNDKILLVLYEAPYGYGGKYAPWSRIIGVIISL